MATEDAIKRITALAYNASDDHGPIPLDTYRDNLRTVLAALTVRTAALERIKAAAETAPNAMDAGEEEDGDDPEITAKLIFKGIASRASQALGETE